MAQPNTPHRTEKVQRPIVTLPKMIDGDRLDTCLHQNNWRNGDSYMKMQKRRAIKNTEVQLNYSVHLGWGKGGLHRWFR